MCSNADYFLSAYIGLYNLVIIFASFAFMDSFTPKVRNSMKELGALDYHSNWQKWEADAEQTSVCKFLLLKLE